MITVLKRPERYSPAGNPVIWQVQSDNNNVAYFGVKLIDYESTAVINQLSIIPTPAEQGTPKRSFLNMSKLLKNVVNWEVNNDTTKLSTPLFKTVSSYFIEITEKVLNAGTIEDGQMFTNATDPYYIFNGELGRIAFNQYLQIKYLVNSTSLASFLTNKPNYSKVNDLSAEHLYFLQDGTVSGLRVRVRTFNGSGQLLDTEIEMLNDIENYKMYRVNCSPKALKDSSNLNMTGVAYYVVDLIDGTATPRTVERVYLYEKTQCHLDYVNLLWVNNLGGLDSYQFVAPQDSISVNRFTIKKNVYDLDGEGLYTDIKEGVYNPSELVISSDVTTVTKVTSKELNDQEAYWLADLYASKQVFVELPDSTLVPVMLNSTSYTIPRLKYVRGSMNTITVDFTLAKGVIPAGLQAYSAKKSNIDFIDSQMNTITFNLPGYSIVVDPRPNNYSDEGYTQSYS